MGHDEPAAARPAVVTAAEMVAGHVGLDISCVDRLYLNGYVAKLQTPGGVIYFFHDHRVAMSTQTGPAVARVNGPICGWRGEAPLAGS